MSTLRNELGLALPPTHGSPMNSSNLIGCWAADASTAKDPSSNVPSTEAAISGRTAARNKPLERKTNSPSAIVAVVDRPGRCRLRPQRVYARPAELVDVLGTS